MNKYHLEFCASDGWADALKTWILPGALVAGTNVEVVHADAAEMPFDEGRFSAAVSFIMLHHVPTAEQQDRIFAELARVLRPGATFAGVDSPDTPEFREMHVDDVCNPLPSATLEGRLVGAGFSEASVELNDYVVQFRARR